MTASALLTAASNLLGTSGAWCTHANARNASGVWCSPGHSTAVAWDLQGSLIAAKERGGYSGLDLWGAYEALHAQIPSTFKPNNRDLEFWNDSLVYADIAGIFTAAQSSIPIDPQNTAA